MTLSTRALLGATILSSFAHPTMAQTTSDENVTALSTIVLGAGLVDGVAIDTPQAVTVVTQEEIDREQATTVGELFDLVPGVQAIGSGRVAGQSFNIRGIGELASSDESRIITTVDGATKFYEQYRLGSFFSDPALYRQVEVLRGPASSTLYGSGVLGGVINFETKDASDFLENTDQALRTQLSYSSNAEEMMASAIFAKRFTENFETLFALNYRTAGNYSDGDGNEYLGSEFDSVSGLVKSRLTFGDDGAQALTMSYTRWDSDLDDTEYAQTNTSGFGTVDREIIDDTLAIRYENPVLGNDLIDLDVVLSYASTQVEQSDSSEPYGPCVTASLFCDSEYGYETTSLKVENTATLGGANYDAYITTGVQLSHLERVATTVAGDLGYHPEGTDDKIGVYAQGEFIFNDRLTIIPGIRADFIALEASSDLGSIDADEVAVSPKLAAHYEINDTYAVFGSLAHTERAPTIDEIFSYSDDLTYSLDLTSETANSAEFGVSASYRDLFGGANAMDVKATFFYSEIEDMIDSDDDSTTYYVNIDEAKIYGLELEAAFESDKMFMRAAYSDVRGEDLSTGYTLTSIPARNLNLTIGGRDQNRGLEYGWQGGFYDEISYTVYDSRAGMYVQEDYASYVVHDLFVDWTPQQGALQGIKAGLRVNNVLDTQYENSLAGDPGEGRSYEISLARTFEF